MYVNFTNEYDNILIITIKNHSLTALSGFFVNKAMMMDE